MRCNIYEENKMKVIAGIDLTWYYERGPVVIGAVALCDFGSFYKLSCLPLLCFEKHRHCICVFLALFFLLLP